MKKKFLEIELEIFEIEDNILLESLNTRGIYVNDGDTLNDDDFVTP